MFLTAVFFWQQQVFDRSLPIKKYWFRKSDYCKITAKVLLNY